MFSKKTVGIYIVLFLHNNLRKQVKSFLVDKNKNNE